MTFEIYDELIGQTFKNVINIADKILSFQFEDGSGYVFYHYQDCCEDVYIEDICGDLYDLEDTPILTAQVIGGESLESDDGETYTDWYFYKFETIRGSVVIRWCGTSNGCYSTKVQMKKIENVLDINKLCW